jgi:hypothetical protein
MDDTAPAAAADPAAPAIDDPLAKNDPNPAYLTALAGALDLADEARVAGLARAIANSKREDLVSALMCHELASCHRLMMRFGAMADHYLSHTSPTVDAERRQVGRDAIGFAAIAARLMARYQQAALALPKLRSEADAVERRIVVDWGVEDCDCRNGNGGNDGGGNQGGGAASGTPPSSPPAGAAGPSAAAPLRRGRLKNGNPSGDYLAAPRCGAKTRAGCACRQPAMKKRRGEAPRPNRPPRPWTAHRRGHRGALRGRRRQPPLGLDDRTRPRDLRWAWGGSLGFVPAAGRCKPRPGHRCVVIPAQPGTRFPETRIGDVRPSTGSGWCRKDL